MPRCPRCQTPMEAVEPAGEAKPYRLNAWVCPIDRVTAEARHPVQYVHIHVGQEDEHDGKRRRVIGKDFLGAELIVFHESFE